MSDTYSIKAFWGIRQETVEQCTVRTLKFLTALAQYDPSFDVPWFDLGIKHSDFDKTREVKVDGESIRHYLLKGRWHGGDDKLLEELGFCLSVWNGDEGEGRITIHIDCGRYSESRSNYLVVILPTGGLLAERLLRVTMISKIIKNTVESWEPDWAVAESWAYERQIIEQEISHPYDARAINPQLKPRMGWMLYLSSSRGAVPPLPAPARIEPIGELGSLIIITDERFTASNEAHVETAARAKQILEDAGMMGPLAGYQPS